MATITRFKLPDVGEGLEDAEIACWHVAVGDTVAINQTICEIETAKSAVELPSPVQGVVETIHVAEGETVAVGTVIISFSADSRSTASKPARPAPAAAEPAEPAARTTPVIVKPAASEPESETEMKVLVGTGPTERAERRRHLRPRAELAALAQQSPSRPRLHVSSNADVAAQADTAPAETRVPIKGVRKATAAAMTSSAFTAPHVTEWLAVDMTETMTLVRALKADERWTGVRVNPLLLVAKALLAAVKRYPEVNASWDEASQEIVHHGAVNLGIAAATPRGLVVPNIKGADRLDLAGLADALTGLIDTARSGRTTPADMSRGTITITNIGALGVDAGTPILNPGEAAILAFGAIRPTPWVVDGQIVVRQVAQLALSFDHRLVDGELGSNVLTEVASVLTRPVQALLRT